MTFRDGALGGADIVDCKGGRGGGICCKLMFQRPSPDVLLWPEKIVLEFFDTVIVDFVKVTVHPSSHNCPTDIRLLWRLGNNDVFVACGLRCVAKGR